MIKQFAFQILLLTALFHVSGICIASAQDTIPPVIHDCPLDIGPVSTDFGSCETLVSWIEPTVTDNNPGATITLISGPGTGSGSYYLTVGITVVEYYAQDSAGNTASCSFTVEVEDNESPVSFDCPTTVGPYIPNQDSCSAYASWTDPTADDNCDGSITLTQVSGPPNGSLFPEGFTTVSYSGADSSGNLVDCTFDVEVDASMAIPTISGCPTDIGPLSPDPSTCEVQVSWAEPAVVPDCAGFTLTQTLGLSSGSTFSYGITTVVYEADDGSGNTDFCTFTVEVDMLYAYASFSWSPSGTTITFSDGSSDVSGWSWDFGDGGSSSQQNPVHTYASTGAFEVCLSVDNACASTDMYCDSVFVSCSGCSANAGSFD